MNKEATFESLIRQFEPRYEVRAVFDDFLTMSMCAVTLNPVTGKSHYEDLYMKTVEKYAGSELRFLFPKMFACLVNEMEKRLKETEGNDVLGEFYESHVARKGAGQFFTPWHICVFMAELGVAEARKADTEKPLRILEPSCGSGRMLLASRTLATIRDEFYAVDIDHTCVKMTTLNLFLNGMFNAEIMCGDFLFPDRFTVSYRISFLPLGIFRIEKKEDSRLWHMLKKEVKKDERQASGDAGVDPNKFLNGNEQLRFF